MEAQKMKKSPPDTPEVGHRCCMRKDPAIGGFLRSYNSDNQWARVDWDEGVSGPKLVHRFELVRVAN